MAEVVKNNTKKTVVDYLQGKEIVFVSGYNRDVYFYKPGTSFKSDWKYIKEKYVTGISFNDNEKFFYSQNQNINVIIDNIDYGELELTVVRHILILVNGLSSLVYQYEIDKIAQMIKSALKENKNKNGY